MSNTDAFKYEIDQSVNEIIDENPGSSQFVALRKISWGGKEFKLDIRKWVTKGDGTEYPTKGVTVTELGGHRLAEGLVALGYGRTEKLVDALSMREDFTCYNIKEDEQVYMDPKEVLK